MSRRTGAELGTREPSGRSAPTTRSSSRTAEEPRQDPSPSPEHPDTSSDAFSSRMPRILHYLGPCSEAGYIRNFRKKERE